MRGSVQYTSLLLQHGPTPPIAFQIGTFFHLNLVTSISRAVQQLEKRLVRKDWISPAGYNGFWGAFTHQLMVSVKRTPINSMEKKTGLTWLDYQSSQSTSSMMSDSNSSLLDLDGRGRAFALLCAAFIAFSSICRLSSLIQQGFLTITGLMTGLGLAAEGAKTFGRLLGMAPRYNCKTNLAAPKKKIC